MLVLPNPNSAELRGFICNGILTKFCVLHAWGDRRWLCSKFADQQRNPCFFANFVIGDEDPFWLKFSHCPTERTTRGCTWFYICKLFGWVSVEIVDVDGINAYVNILMTISSRNLSNCFTTNFIMVMTNVFGGRKIGKPELQRIAVRNRLLDTFQRRVIARHLPVECPASLVPLVWHHVISSFGVISRIRFIVRNPVISTTYECGSQMRQKFYVMMTQNFCEGLPAEVRHRTE